MVIILSGSDNINYKIKKLPQEERPRERLMALGANNLSDKELLAIVIKAGYKNESALSLAVHDNTKFKTIKNLNNITYHELVKIKGIKRAKASAILAAIELGKRIFLIKNKQIKINDFNDIYYLINPLVKDLKHEEFYTISLNSKSVVLSVDKIATGNNHSVSVDFSAAFRPAIKSEAFSIIICHNHPSGNAKPSEEDLKFTKSIVNASKMINIKITDHIIIGDEQFYSFLKNDKVYLNNLEGKNYD